MVPRGCEEGRTEDARRCVRYGRARAAMKGEIASGRILFQKDAMRKIAAKPKKRRVFLVDDHPLVREWLASLVALQPDLEVCGQAEDAPAALAAVQEVAAPTSSSSISRCRAARAWS